MNKTLQSLTIASLFCIPLAAQAWGPYGENPYWNGYGPGYPAPYAGIPYWNGYPAPAYGVPRYYGYGAPWVNYAPPMYGQHGYRPYGSYMPWSQPMAMDRNMPADVQKMLKQAEKQRKRAMKLSAARYAEFRNRMKAQRAAAQAKRDAWQQRMNQYAPSYPVATDTNPAEPQMVQPESQQTATPNAGE